MVWLLIFVIIDYCTPRAVWRPITVLNLNSRSKSLFWLEIKTYEMEMYEDLNLNQFRKILLEDNQQNPYKCVDIQRKCLAQKVQASYKRWVFKA